MSQIDYNRQERLLNMKQSWLKQSLKYIKTKIILEYMEQGKPAAKKQTKDNFSLKGLDGEKRLSSGGHQSRHHHPCLYTHAYIGLSVKTTSAFKIQCQIWKCNSFQVGRDTISFPWKIWVILEHGCSHWPADNSHCARETCMLIWEYVFIYYNVI